MIGNMIGKGEAAIYSVAYNIAAIMQIVITAINSSFTPYMYKSIKDGECSGVRRNSKIIISLVGLACIGVMALGPEVISIFAPVEYYDAIWIVPPVACAVYFKFLYPLFSTVEFYYEKTGFVMIASCIAAGANIILNYIFIRIYGYYAAGYTTLVCYILYSLAHYAFQRRVAAEHDLGGALFDMRYIVVFSIFMLGTMTCMLFLYPYRILRYMICAVLAAVLIYLFMKNRELFMKRKQQ
jgi:O-antigen/teichoic acid export membrane protein